MFIFNFCMFLICELCFLFRSAFIFGCFYVLIVYTPFSYFYVRAALCCVLPTLHFGTRALTVDLFVVFSMLELAWRLAKALGVMV